jgi:hypothetical protein
MAIIYKILKSLIENDHKKVLLKIDSKNNIIINNVKNIEKNKIEKNKIEEIIIKDNYVNN